MIAVSCSGKFHAFALAEQLEAHGMLGRLYTVYSYKKNTLLRHAVKRVDKENIPVDHISTFPLLAFPIRFFPDSAYIWNNYFDQWVSRMIGKEQPRAIIGWSGMSLSSLKKQHQFGGLAILERGSSHIEVQNEILQTEYKRFNLEFSIDPRVINKELKEYQEADFISVPSLFVKKSFIERGISENKLFLNNYGASAHFRRVRQKMVDKFIVLYLGAASVQKGVVYLFQALQQLNIPASMYEVWFVGSVQEEMQATIKKYNQPNWIWKGHVPHYELPEILADCDVAVQPSLQDGFGMVINQTLACGIPTIATTNTGGPDIIQEDKTGFIVPIRDPEAIARHIETLFNDTAKLEAMKIAAEASVQEDFTWEAYGNRYVQFLQANI